MVNFASENLIPEGIKDESTIAMSKCIDEISNTDVSKVLVYLLNNVHPTVLDYLAKQFHVEGIEGWAFAETTEDKIRLIENSIPMHKVKGTIPSVITSLSSLSYETQIVKYTDYNGIPKHYKIKIISTEKDLSLQNQANIIEMTDEYKQQNSVLDGLLIELPHKGDVYWGGSSVIGVKVTIGEE